MDNVFFQTMVVQESQQARSHTLMGVPHHAKQAEGNRQSKSDLHARSAAVIQMLQINPGCEAAQSLACC
jgi:hypothetical protein